MRCLPRLPNERDVTFFRKVVSKSSAGYHGIVWAEFRKLKTRMDNYRINMMIVSNIISHGVSSAKKLLLRNFQKGSESVLSAYTRQTAVDTKCTSYTLTYLKYLHKCLFTAYVTANVKYVNTFACMTYLRKIVVFCIFDTTCHKQTCRPQLSYVNMSHMHMCCICGNICGKCIFMQVFYIC